VTVAGTHVYVTDVYSGLYVIDVSDPADPRIVGSVGTPGLANGVAVAGSYAYVADGQSGLMVIDISNPAAPQIVGEADTPDNAHGVAVLGTYAFVADSHSGLQVIDVSDPAAPQIVGGVDTPGIALGVALDGTHAYIADDALGLQVIDISIPAAPRIVGGIGTLTSAKGVAVETASAYVADLAAGLKIAPAQCDFTPCRIQPEATALADGILISWQVLDAAGLTGFRVYRQASESEWVCISPILPSSGEGYRYLDTEVEPGVRYEYLIEASGPGGLSDRFGPVSAEWVAPSRLTLRVLPNPSAGLASVAFTLPKAGDVVLRLYDVRGREVARNNLAGLHAGAHVIPWAPRDGGDRRLASGAYYVQIDALQGHKVIPWVIVR
jgi:hypothetical protein